MSNLNPLRSRLPSAHQAVFDEFAKDLQTAVQHWVPTDLNRYERAAILAFDWNNDTMGVSNLRNDLLRLLNRVYGFKVEVHVLDANAPSADIALEFRRKLMDFTAKNGSTKANVKNLLAYYYSGHSDSGPNGDMLRLAGRVDASGNLIYPYLNWYAHSHFALDVPYCETLLLLDSCNSAMASVKPEGEILTAAGWETTASSSLPYSFTQIMIDEIRSMNGKAFTICDLHNLMMQNPNMQATPNYKNKPKHPSVLIHKIGSREAQQLVRADRTSRGKVLITVSVSNDVVPDVHTWHKWLSSFMPTDIRNIEIIGRWESTSCVILVAVPIQVWDRLRDDPAYSFVSFLMGDVQLGYPSPEGSVSRMALPGQPP